MTGAQPTAAMVQMAAFWAAQLAGGGAGRSDRDACERWCDEHPLHRIAMQRMGELDNRVDAVDDAGHKALASLLVERKRRKRRLGGTAMAVSLTISGTLLATQSFAVRELFPAYATAIGEQRQVALADGSRLNMDTDAALDVRLSGGKRSISLFRGRVRAQVARDPSRPFVVETRDGTATALGTAFTVEKDGAGTTVVVLQSHVRACAARQDGGCLDMSPGQRVRLDGMGIRQLADVDTEHAAAWADGWLTVDDRPVAEVLVELNRYRADPIRFDAAALAGRNVSGSFPLRDTERALAGISRATGLRFNSAPDGPTR